MIGLEDIKDIKRRLDVLETVRSRILPQWVELRDYVFSDGGFFSSLGEYKDDGKKTRRYIINGTASKAVDTLAAGLQGGLTSPSRPWFSLGVSDQELREAIGVRTWLQDTRDLMLRVFARSNFYECLHQVYTELAVFGTGGIIIEDEDSNRVIRCRSLTVGEYWIDTDADGNVDTLFIRNKMNVRALVKKFGLDQVGPVIREQHAAKNYHLEHDVIHLICPRSELGETVEAGRRDAAGMPWASLWFLENPGDGTSGILRESGYRVKPFAVTRWRVRGHDVWGKSPGMDALGDCQMLQKMERTKLEVMDKEARPPMIAPPSIMNRGGVNIVAGGVTFADMSKPNESVAPAFQVRPDIRNTSLEIDNVERRIGDIFYTNLFLSIIAEGKQMTAREVVERSQEKMMLLGPVVERFQSELLDPIIERVFDQLEFRGAIFEAPEELQGEDVRPEYISLLAQAQKIQDVQAIQDSIQFAASMAPLVPDIMDKIDTDQSVDEYSRLIGAPSRIIRSDEDVAKIREGRAQQMAQQQQQAALSQATQDAKNLGGIQMDESNALTAMIDQAF